MAASAGFVENFVLLREASYFDSASELKPLMHIWSLGIEEQYYLVYPVTVWLAYRAGGSVLSIIIVLAIISFGLNVGGIENAATKTFFLPQTRLWELLVGGILAYLQLFKKTGGVTSLRNLVVNSPQSSKLPSRLLGATYVHNALAWIGLLLLLIAVLFLDRDKPFPGWWALVPVSSACLLILSGSNAWLNRRVLASRLMVFIGIISYPLYLWHWPLLSFARISEGEILSSKIRVAIVAASVLLAWVTYLLIERPIRFGRNVWPKTMGSITLLAIIGYLGYNAFERDGLGFRMKDRGDYVSYFENSTPTLKYMMANGIWQKDRVECNFLDAERWRNGESDPPPRETIDKSCYTPTTSRAILIWGDSHAAHLSHGLVTVLPKEISVLQVTTSGCAPQIVETVDPNFDACQKSNAFALQLIKKQVPETVVMAQASGHDQVNNVEQIAARLKSLGVRKILFLGPVPQWEPYLYKLIAKKYWIFTPTRIATNLKAEVFSADKILREKFAARNSNLEYVSLINFFCNEQGCMTYIGDDKRDGLLTYDHGHLTPVGSIFLATKLLAPLILKING